jgi:hypothetical protein
MSLLSFLASAAGGTVLGGITQLLGTFASEAKEWSASKRRIAELQAMKERDIAIGELTAFTKAQDGFSASYTPPPTAPAWTHAVFTIVEAIIKLIRPTMVVGACWYLWNLPQPEIDGLRPEIVAFCFSIGYAWIGIRVQKQAGGK